jgi:hypothetical protein
VHAPELAGEGGRPFVLLTARDGFLGFLLPRAFVYEGWHDVPGAIARAPSAIRFTAGNEDDSLAVRFRVSDVTASLPGGEARLGAGRAFLQMRGTYEVNGHVGGRPVRFEANGAAETFVPID